MSLVEAIRQGAVVAAEFAALLTITPAYATPSDRDASARVPAAATRTLTVSHALAGPLSVDGLRPLALMRIVETIEVADDDDSDEPCGAGNEADMDDDDPVPHVVIGIDEAIADRSLATLVINRHRSAPSDGRNP